MYIRTGTTAMITSTVICAENEWVVKNSQDVLYIESTPIVTCRVLILHDQGVGGMLHVKDEQGINKISDFLGELEKLGMAPRISERAIALKSLDVDYQKDPVIRRLIAEVGLTAEDVYTCTIPMDGKRVVRLSLKDGRIDRF